MRSINFDPAAWEDFLFWLASDRKTARRIPPDSSQKSSATRLLGLENQNRSRVNYPGNWSRRIDDEHRIVYRADDNEIKILKARYHY